MRKLNLHYSLNAEGQQYCLEVNSGIRQITTSAVVFGADPGAAIPHVTVFMGRLRDDNNISIFTTALKAASVCARRCTFKIGRPYISITNGRYILSDVEADSSLVELRSSLQKALSPYMEISGGSDPNEAHVTLGYITKEYDAVSNYLDTLPTGPWVVSDSLELSDAGPKGTSINSLLKISLQ